MEVNYIKTIIKCRRFSIVYSIDQEI